ncbi:unnamed protein product, partial [Mesorhabditis belari]|uniref:Galactokinase n=1 Tax=Mesorhabditis belari TaxID=2138241 RepID=A0AAF3J686_9BILA
MPLPSQWNGASPPQWFDYPLCGWKGVLEAIQQPPRGMLILVKGTIPPSSGLSSSSALVCAAALATLVLHTGHGFTSMHNKEWLADLCAKAEHMIGTCGGGMDQACEVKTAIPANVSAEEVIAEIGKDNLTALLTENTKHMKEFNLRPRALHCFGEAQRVNDFEEACKREDLIAMGQLMNQSHKSLQENYENTSPGIDKLINECKKANVLGVRMTGGGWGGCLVALIDKNNPIDLSQLNVLFNSSPCQGITFEELYDQK